LEQPVEIRKPFGKYYLALVALAASFLAICILIAYFVGNQALGLFGTFYAVLLIFGMFMWQGKVENEESNAFGGFVMGTIGLFAISIFAGIASRQASFLVSTTAPGWLQMAATATHPIPTFFNIPIPNLVTTVMNVPGPVAEESFCRIFLWRVTSPALGKKKMLGGQAIIFGAIHYFAFGGNYVQIAVAMVAGVWMGYVYWKTNSELAISSSHLVYNLGALLISLVSGIILMRI
jgi:membrane protease YdiL (CAAX protease family)